MGKSWLPQSAAALASGAIALTLGTLLLPSSSGSEQLVGAVQTKDAQWLMACVAFFIASFGLTLGLPAVLSLSGARGRRTLGSGVAVFSVATIGLSGYAAFLVFFRAVVVDELIAPEQVAGLSSDTGLTTFLGVFVAAFYLGELLIAVGLLRSRSVPQWVPVLLLAHVASLVVRDVLPDGLQPFLTLLFGVALVGAAVAANDSTDPVRRRAYSQLPA